MPPEYISAIIKSCCSFSQSKAQLGFLCNYNSKNSLEMLHSRFKLTEERISELEDRPVENFKLRDRGKNKRTVNRASEKTSTYA